MTIADLAFPMCQNHAMSPSIMIRQTGALSMEALACREFRDGALEKKIR